MSLFDDMFNESSVSSIENVPTIHGVSFIDKRGATFGQQIEFDVDRMGKVVDDFAIIDGTLFSTIKVEANLATPKQVDTKQPGVIGFHSEGEVTLHLAVSDKLEFSEKALRRLNRNYVILVRLADSLSALATMYGPATAATIMEEARKPLFSDAYRYARDYIEGMATEELPIRAVPEG